MATSEERLSTVEKDIATMKRDIIYKLDDTNSAVTIIKGVVGRQGQDLKYLINQAKGLDIRLEGVEVQLDDLSLEVKAIKALQDTQGQDISEIKRRLGTIDQRFDGVDQHLDSLDKKFDQMLGMLTTLTNKPE